MPVKRKLSKHLDCVCCRSVLVSRDSGQGPRANQSDLTVNQKLFSQLQALPILILSELPTLNPQPEPQPRTLVARSHVLPAAFFRFRLSLLEIEPLVLPPWIMDAAFPSRDRVLLASCFQNTPNKKP